MEPVSRMQGTIPRLLFTKQLHYLCANPAWSLRSGSNRDIFDTTEEDRPLSRRHGARRCVRPAFLAGFEPAPPANRPVCCRYTISASRAHTSYSVGIGRIELPHRTSKARRLPLSDIPLITAEGFKPPCYRRTHSPRILPGAPDTRCETASRNGGI
jgi:hypothetical protein